MIIGYLVVDFSGVQIIENVENIPEFQKGTMDKLTGNFFYSLKVLFKSIFDSEFRVLKLDSLTVTIHPFEQFIIFLVLTDENYLNSIIAANELSHLCYRLLDSKPKDKPFFFKLDELKRFRLDFDLVITKINDQFNDLCSAKELIDLANQIYSGIQFNDSDKSIKLPIKTIFFGKIDRIDDSLLINTTKEFLDYPVLQWTRNWEWGNFLALDKASIEKLSPEWKQALAINAHLYLRGMSSEFQVLSLIDIKILIKNLNNSLYRDLLYAKYIRFIKPGTYTKISFTYKENLPNIENVLNNSDDDPEKQTLIFLLIDVTNRNLQNKLLAYFEKNHIEFWKGQSRETLFIINNFQLPPKDDIQELISRFDALKHQINTLKTSILGLQNISDVLNENLYRTLHQLFFLGHHILIHPNLSYSNGLQILKDLYTLWCDSQVSIKDPNKVFYSNKSKGLFSYFGYSSLLPLLLNLDINSDPEISMDLNLIKLERIEALKYITRNFGLGHIELEMYNIVSASALSGISCVLNFLNEYSPDIPRLLSEFTTETYFTVASGLPYYHWALFYIEMINSLLETALQLPTSTMKDNILTKLINNQHTFLFNTNIVSYTIIFWPALFRLLSIYLKWSKPEMLVQAQQIVQKVSNVSSPFWKEAFTKLFNKNGIPINFH